MWGIGRLANSRLLFDWQHTKAKVNNYPLVTLEQLWEQSSFIVKRWKDNLISVFVNKNISGKNSFYVETSSWNTKLSEHELEQIISGINMWLAEYEEMKEEI
jgi:hypothetical protein